MNQLYVVVFEWWETYEASGFHVVATLKTKEAAEKYAARCTEIAKELLFRHYAVDKLASTTDDRDWAAKQKEMPYLQHPLDKGFDPSDVGYTPYDNDYRYKVYAVPGFQDAPDHILPPFDIPDSNKDAPLATRLFNMLYKPIAEELGAEQASRAVMILEDEWGKPEEEIIQAAERLLHEFLGE